MASTKLQINQAVQNALDLYHNDRLQDAIAQLSAARKRLPAAAQIDGYLAFLHSEAGDTAAADRLYRKATELSPKSELASLGLFHALWNLKRTDDAFDEMRRFMKANDSAEYRAILRGMLADPPTRKTKELVPA